MHKRYGQLQVVDGLSLRLQPGECYGIIGPNGAGKTTTIQLCLGLARPDSGRILLMGQPVPDSARQARLRVGVVTQFDSLDPDFTVEENLMVFGRYFGLRDEKWLGFSEQRDKWMIWFLDRAETGLAEERR